MVIDCITNNFLKKEIQIDTVLDNYENHLIKKKYLNKKINGRYKSFFEKMKKKNAIIATVPQVTYDKLDSVGGHNFINKDCLANIKEVDTLGFELYGKFMALGLKLGSANNPSELAEVYLDVFSNSDFETPFFRVFILLTLGWISEVDNGRLPSFKMLSPIDN